MSGRTRSRGVVEAAGPELAALARALGVEASLGETALGEKTGLAAALVARARAAAPRADEFALDDPARAFAKLAPDLREALALVAIAGFSYDAAAGIVGVTRAELATRVALARVALDFGAAGAAGVLRGLPGRRA